MRFGRQLVAVALLVTALTGCGGLSPMVAVVREVVEAVREKSSLEPCSDRYLQMGGRCIAAH